MHLLSSWNSLHILSHLLSTAILSPWCTSFSTYRKREKRERKRKVPQPTEKDVLWFNQKTADAFKHVMWFNQKNNLCIQTCAVIQSKNNSCIQTYDVIQSKKTTHAFKRAVIQSKNSWCIQTCAVIQSKKQLMHSNICCDSIKKQLMHSNICCDSIKKQLMHSNMCCDSIKKNNSCTQTCAVIQSKNNSCTQTCAVIQSKNNSCIQTCAVIQSKATDALKHACVLLWCAVYIYSRGLKWFSKLAFKIYFIWKPFMDKNLYLNKFEDTEFDYEAHFRLKWSLKVPRGEKIRLIWGQKGQRFCRAIGSGDKNNTNINTNRVIIRL